MIPATYKKIIDLIDSNPIPILIFFTSIFIFISFAGTRLFLSDEGVILDQFYNLIHGSLAIKIAKINTVKGVFILVGDNLYGIFSYSLLILSLPTYYILSSIDFLFGAHLFLLVLWAISGGFIVYLAAKIRKSNHAAAGGIITYLVLISINLPFFKSILFPKWGELLSIEFTNILISSLLVLLVYLFFKDFFGNKIAILASFFVIFATPVSFYAVTLKHHSLTLLLTMLTFYFFYKFYEKKDNKLIYLAYIFAGLCVWTRTLDGAVLMASLLMIDVIVLRRGVKKILTIFTIILISLLPFFIFNYLILGNPFSIIESTPLADRPVKLYTAQDYISLEQSSENDRQVELLNELGYIWKANIRGDWFDILRYSLFLKLMNTFGVLLVSPFLIAAFAFAVDRIKRKIKLNVIEKFLGSYVILLLGAYILLKNLFDKNYLFSIITDTPIVLEYRYLLILYIILLYFALRIDKLKDLIENNIKMIISLYVTILIIIFIYFAAEFPVPFLNIYYRAALLTSISLIMVLSISLLIPKKRNIALDKLTIFIVALSLSLATSLLGFYYWVDNMTYISPSQNYTILPVLGNILRWMHQIIF